jgi:hypothetical protein
LDEFEQINLDKFNSNGISKIPRGCKTGFGVNKLDTLRLFLFLNESWISLNKLTWTSLTEMASVKSLKAVTQALA